jgi:hypothetical protein
LKFATTYATQVNNIDLGGVQVRGIELGELFSHLAKAFQRPAEEIARALKHEGTYTRHVPMAISSHPFYGGWDGMEENVPMGEWEWE